MIAYAYRVELFGTDKPVRLATAGALVIIGRAVARNLGRALQPHLAQRLCRTARSAGSLGSRTLVANASAVGVGSYRPRIS